MNKTNLLPLSAAFLFSANIFAEDKNIYQQEKTVVTASRYEQQETDVIPSITVISREDILNLQANSITDVLTLHQGIDVARNGGNGSATSVFMRGTNSNHTLVLIDGMRVASSYTGSFAWEHLPISQVQRIEIVRGTRVSYYGSDAIGGVINIITRKQENLYVRYTGGSYDTHNFDVGYGGSSENTQYSIVIGSQKTDGFSATNFNNSFAFNPDDDGYENLSLNIKASMEIENGDVNFNYLETKADIDFDSFYNVGNSDVTERVARLAWNGELFSDWQSEVALGHNKNSLATKAFSNSFDSSRLTLDLLLNKQLNNNHLSFGLSYRNEESDFKHSLVSQLNYDNTRNNAAAFGNWRGDYGNNTISVSGRYDHNSVYGNDTSGDFDWAYKFNDNIRLNFSVGTAFHAPNLNELFSPSFQTFIFSPVLGEFAGFFSFEGNPDLKPEESTNYEIGLKTKFADNHDLSFNVFYYDIENLVTFGEPPTYKPENINESTIKGVEVAYNYRNNGVNLNINATHQDANNDQLDMPLLRRPDNKVNLSVDKFFNRFSIGSSLKYASSNPDFGVLLSGYSVIDLRAAFKINEHWRLATKWENATDKEYQIINGYNTSGSAAYLTIEWQQ